MAAAFPFFMSVIYFMRAVMVFKRGKIADKEVRGEGGPCRSEPQPAGSCARGAGLHAACLRDMAACA